MAAGEAPFRRSNLGVIVGTALAVLLSGGAVVYGLISPAASSAWRNPGAVIVEKETGTRYLYLGGELRPTANYASALLAAGQKPSVQYVGRDTLHGIAVGATIGIPGAPEELPSAAAHLEASTLASRLDDAAVDPDHAFAQPNSRVDVVRDEQ